MYGLYAKQRIRQTNSLSLSFEWNPKGPNPKATDMEDTTKRPDDDRSKTPFEEAREIGRLPAIWDGLLIEGSRFTMH